MIRAILLKIFSVVTLVFSVVMLIVVLDTPFALRNNWLIGFAVVLGMVSCLSVVLFIMLDMWMIRTTALYCPNCHSRKRQPWLCGMCGWMANRNDIKIIKG